MNNAQQVWNQLFQKGWNTRYTNLEDYFTITCRKCGSTDVWLHSEECGECGTYINAECNKCGAKYDYHDFKQVKIRYGKRNGRNVEIWREQI